MIWARPIFRQHKLNNYWGLIKTAEGCITTKWPLPGNKVGLVMRRTNTLYHNAVSSLAVPISPNKSLTRRKTGRVRPYFTTGLLDQGFDPQTSALTAPQSIDAADALSLEEKCIYGRQSWLWFFPSLYSIIMSHLLHQSLCGSSRYKRIWLHYLKGWKPICAIVLNVVNPHPSQLFFNALVSLKRWDFKNIIITKRVHTDNLFLASFMSPSFRRILALM